MRNVSLPSLCPFKYQSVSWRSSCVASKNKSLPIATVSRNRRVQGLGGVENLKAARANFVLCLVFFFGISISLFAAPPALKGDASDADGNLEWISDATNQSGRWIIGNWVTNRATAGHLRVEWKTNAYDGWVPAPPTPENMRGSNVDGGVPEPQARKGTIQYGTNGTKTAPFYGPGTVNEGRMEKTSCDLRLTLPIHNTLRDVFIKVTSTKMSPKESNFEIRYAITLQQKELADYIQMEWSAAASPLLKKLLLERHESGMIRLNRETAVEKYTIISTSKPVLREGALIIKDRDGKKLGAAYAPAFAPSAP